MELLTKKVLVRFNEAEYEALQATIRETGQNQNTLIRKVVAYACGVGDVHEEIESKKVTDKVQHAANMRARRWAGHEPKRGKKGKAETRSSALDAEERIADASDDLAAADEEG